MIGQDIDINTKKPIGELRSVEKKTCKCEECGRECDCKA
jgi:hypothetical protein